MFSIGYSNNKEWGWGGVLLFVGRARVTVMVKTSCWPSIVSYGTGTADFSKRTFKKNTHHIVCLQLCTKCSVVVDLINKKVPHTSLMASLRCFVSNGETDSPPAAPEFIHLLYILIFCCTLKSRGWLTMGIDGSIPLLKYYYQASIPGR